MHVLRLFLALLALAASPPAGADVTTAALPPGVQAEIHGMTFVASRAGVRSSRASTRCSRAKRARPASR
jgi:hypothetical protein